MSKLDIVFRNMELLNDDGEDCSEDVKRQIKDLMLELIGDPEKTDSTGRYNCIMEFRQKVNEL